MQFVMLDLLFKGSIALFCTITAAVAAENTNATVDYNRDVLPILSDNCFKCHGPDSGSREAGLRLDQSKSAISELDSGMFAIVPHEPDSSALVERIESEDEFMIMPPVDSGKKLTASQKETLRRWIAEGAAYAPHWAFVPPIRPAVPPIDSAGSITNPVDAFVFRALTSRGLKASPAASKERLIRRVTFDLTGLPPTIEEINEFLADESPDAYQRVIDRLLASPHYGERMAVDWLDGARFADSNGYQNDYTRNMTPWRDWVIEAFNTHMPYDQFLIEQLAGDLLPKPTLEQRIATGFNRNHRTVTESGSIEEEWLVENVVDRTETFGAVVLGLTVGCARCHDHKFDPVSQREFFQLYAFFNNVDEKGFYNEVRGNVPPLVQVMTPEHKSRLAEYDDKITDIAARLAEQNKELPRERREWLESLAKFTPESVPIPLVEISLDGKVDGLISVTGASVSATTEAPSAEGAKVAPQLEWLDGVFGKAARFAGSQCLSYLELNFPITDAAFSWAAWVKPQGTGALYSKMNVAAGFRGWDALLLDDGRIAVHLIHQWPDNAIKIVTKEKIHRDQWAHLTVAYDGSRKADGVTVFFNGKRQGITVDFDCLSDTIATDEPFRLGKRSTEMPLSALMRDVRLFDFALDQQQVASVVTSSLASALPSDIDESKDNDTLTAFDDLLVTFSSNPQVEKTAQLRRELDSVKQDRAKYDSKIPTTMVMAERKEPRKTHLLERGHYASPDTSEDLSPSIPASIGTLPSDAPRNRLGLAHWAVSPDNPLTARVMVNRLWQQFFGNPLVATPDNLGVQSPRPVHPELLDWLATEFIHSGWNIQHIQRLIATSNTYRQQSDSTSEAYQDDPDNIWLARGPRHRLRAEAVRDNALAISGLLVDKIGGPSVMPYQPKGLWEELAGGAFETYVEGKGDDLFRRSLYTFRKRTVPHPSMATFDAPSWEVCLVKRATTDTPLQALALLNDVTYVEAARKLAERLMKEGGATDDERLVYAFRLATGRHPAKSELQKIRRSLENYRAHFAKLPEEAKKLLSHGRSPYDKSLDKVELASHSVLAGVLLNLDETITKN